jgi:hypothetical protein
MAQCLAHPSRIDFSLSPVLSEQSLTLPVIEDGKHFHDELSWLLETIGNGIAVGYVVRIAVFLHFVFIKQTYLDANREISKVIPAPYSPKITDEEDFVFQINQPRISEHVQNTKLNFITKWSVEGFQIATQQIMVGALAGMPRNLSPTSTLPEQNAASVQFDNNSVP